MGDVLAFPEKLAKTYWLVYHEIKEVQAQLNYDHATGLCTNCPRRGDSAEYPIAEECCKNDPDYGATEEAYLKQCKDLLAMIKKVLGDDADYLLECAK